MNRTTHYIYIIALLLLLGAATPALAQTIKGNVYGGGQLGKVAGNTNVTIESGTIEIGASGGSNIFGGGYQAEVAGNTTIDINGGEAGNVYGGGEAADIVVGADETGKTVVNMNGGTVHHSVYGGGLGNETNVVTSTTVTANGGTVTEDIYGGSGFGTVGATTVTINNGATVTRDVFGGGFGSTSPAYEADVNGNASVTINKGASIRGNVYGGNNTNGSPKGAITVLVDGPRDEAEKTTTPLVLKDVFGGGKNAATTSLSNDIPAPKVTIKGCETVIARVFGGGDAASAPATDVEIWGGHIGNAFAGGNGEIVAAHVGYQADGTTEYNYGTGNTNITIKGGVIENVFGGSNTAGNIRREVSVTVKKDDDACDMQITNLYGGGNEAPGKAGTISIVCTGDGRIENVYGGANRADVTGDITLNIKGGQITNVFGGNNNSGNINGAITVNVDWATSVGACGTNSLTNVYGGGNLAPYTTPVGKVGPTVQLINATINNNVYGGGLGAAAKVTGSPIVTLEGATVGTTATIEAGTGGRIFGGGDAAPVEGNPTVTATEGSADKIFAGGKGATAVVTGNPTAVLNKTDEKTLTLTEIYGGGDAAEVTGNTTVTLTKGSVTNAFGGGNAAAINGATAVTIANATASNVYGGGNLAGVSQTTTVTMNGGNVTTGLYGGCNTSGTVTGDIAVSVTNGNIGTDAEHKANVHGGGYGFATQTAGNVAVAVNGAGVIVYGDIYGGSALGNVNDNTDDNTTVTITAGTVNGDVYGGGLGDATNAALVKGNVAVNINGGTVTGNVFGCNNVNGTPKGRVAVTVANNANADLNEVYGGGNMANYEPTTDQAPVVTINDCGTSINYVYGGGNAANVHATNVTVWGGTIGNVFGGGHGDKDANPATEANVTGNASVTIKGGTIEKVFAGSNSKGSIGGNASLNIAKEGACEMHITEVYGGGNQAEGKAGTIEIGCTGTATEGIGDVYGGAREANITTDIALVIKGGNIDRVFGGNNVSGNIAGSIQVDINEDLETYDCGLSLNNVYGAGNQADYTGSPAVNILKGTVSENVFGGGLEATVTGNPIVTVNGGTVTLGAYGGGALANVEGNTTVNLMSGTVTGNAYGGGLGQLEDAGAGKEAIAALVNGNTQVNLGAMVDDGEGNLAPTGTATVGNIFGCNNLNGSPNGTATVYVISGTVNHNVYGGGNLAAATVTPSVNINGGTVTENVYGGGYGASAVLTGNPTVNVTGGTVSNDVYGGGALADVTGNTTINVSDNGTVTHDVYGGGALADITGNTTVNLFGGAVGGAYGGGLGQLAVAAVGTEGEPGYVPAKDNIEAFVTGNTTVTLGKLQDNGTYTASKITETGIFGANNINGTPQGHAFVHVIKTTPRDGQATPHNQKTENSNSYDVPAVYGGGNKAAYEPSQATYDAEMGFAEVLIENCDNSIEYVYGGGNAAPVPATKVKIYGADAINHAFAGGNGKGVGNKGADVGYLNFYSTGSREEYGTGTASIAVYGGTVHNVYGGSNTLGYIRGGSTVSAEADPSYAGTRCDLNVDNVFGGGNEAPMDCDITMTIECTEGGKVLYAGANNADVNGNITLNIRSGTFEQVFCGNNRGGAVRGKLEINVEETGCTPIIIKELFGGGNLAPYSVYGYNDDGSCKTSGERFYDDPTINVISCTAIGTVYGGGYGNTAVMYGNPIVNVDMVKGKWATTSISRAFNVIKDGEFFSPSESPVIPNSIGVIGNIFGGGKEAAVYGNTTVNVCVNDANKDANIAPMNGELRNIMSFDEIGSNVSELEARIFIDYEHTNTLGSGLDLQGTTTKPTVEKIHNNTDVVNCIALEDSYSTKGDQLVLSGSFKAGDIVSLSGFYNNSSSKVAAVSIFEDDQSDTSNNTSPHFINGQTSNEEPTQWSYTVKTNTDHLYIRRAGATKTYIYTLKVSGDRYTPEDSPTGSIYGGGKLANVNGNTKVHIRNGSVEGNVFGAGQGDAAQPDAAAVSGKTEVIIGEE